MPEAVPGPETITVDRNEFARVMNVWVTHFARCLMPEVERDPDAVLARVRRFNRDFTAAVTGETRSDFLKQHAFEFAEAIEAALGVNTTQERFRGEPRVQRRKAREAEREAKARVQTVRRYGPQRVKNPDRGE